jgi:hypothetical protein
LPHWVAVPKAMRARRANRGRRHGSAHKVLVDLREVALGEAEQRARVWAAVAMACSQ